MMDADQMSRRISVCCCCALVICLIAGVPLCALAVVVTSIALTAKPGTLTWLTLKRDLESSVHSGLLYAALYPSVVCCVVFVVITILCLTVDAEQEQEQEEEVEESSVVRRGHEPVTKDIRV